MSAPWPTFDNAQKNHCIALTVLSSGLRCFTFSLTSSERFGILPPSLPMMADVVQEDYLSEFP